MAVVEDRLASVTAESKESREKVFALETTSTELREQVWKLREQVWDSYLPYTLDKRFIAFSHNLNFISRTRSSARVMSGTL